MTDQYRNAYDYLGRYVLLFRQDVEATFGAQQGSINGYDNNWWYIYPRYGGIYPYWLDTEDPAVVEKIGLDSYDGPMYSILNNIENFKGTDDKYHLKYVSVILNHGAGDIASTKRTNEWKQTHNPVNTVADADWEFVDGVGRVPGYEAIDVEYTNDGTWGGLSKQYVRPDNNTTQYVDPGVPEYEASGDLVVGWIHATGPPEGTYDSENRS